MILYHQASNSLKLAFLQHLQAFLLNKGIQDHFGVTTSPEGALRIIPRIYNPYASTQLNDLLDNLQNARLVTYVRETIGPHTGNLPPLRVTQINPHFESLLAQLKAPNPPVASTSNAASPYPAADNHTPFHYPQAVPQAVSSSNYTQAPPTHQNPPPFLVPSRRNDFSPSPAPMPQPATSAQIKSLELKIILLQQRWRHSPLHEVVNNPIAIMIDGERFISVDELATPRSILEQQLQALGLQKLSSGNSFGYSEFRTPIPIAAWQQAISAPSTIYTQMPFVPAQPSWPVPSAIPGLSVPPTPMTNFASPIPSAPPRQLPIVSIETALQQHHWRKPLPEESVDYPSAILLDEDFFIPILPHASARNIIETILVSLHGCQQSDSSGSFGYPEFKRPSRPSPVPVQAVSSSSPANSQGFFAPNRAAVASQPPISASTSSNPAASLANPAPEFSPPSSGSSAPSLAQPPATPLVRRSLAPQPISAAEARIIKGRLDPLIIQHWNEFSEPLQQHILYCNRGNLQSKFDLMQTVKFSDTFVSPIGLGLVRDIPVRLPSSDTAENKKYYNLTELLSLHERIDPCANTPFTLKDIRPAPETLAELKKRLPEVSPHAIPRKGLGSH